MAQNLEDQVCSEAAICPCCGRALLVQIDVIGLPDGGLALNYLKLAHADSQVAVELDAALNRLPRRR